VKIKRNGKDNTAPTMPFALMVWALIFLAWVMLLWCVKYFAWYPGRKKESLGNFFGGHIPLEDSFLFAGLGREPEAPPF
jgi:hypothetical protein